MGKKIYEDEQILCHVELDVGHKMEVLNDLDKKFEYYFHCYSETKVIQEGKMEFMTAVLTQMSYRECRQRS